MMSSFWRKNDRHDGRIPLKVLRKLVGRDTNQDTMTMDCIHQLWDDNSSQASDEPEYVFVEAAPDHMPSSEELARRNRRRALNREAANRHAKVGKLENEIDNLKLDGRKLREENVSLKAEIEQLKFQLQWKQTSIPQTQHKMLAVQQSVGFARG